MKEIVKGRRITGKILFVHGFKKLILVKCVYYIKQSNEILIKIPITFSIELWKTMLKFIWKRPRLVKVILRKKNIQVEGVILILKRAAKQ